MKTLADYEKELKAKAYKWSDFQKEADSVSIEDALLLIKEAAKSSFERGYCAGVITQPNASVDDMADDIKNRWSGLRTWFDKEFSK